MKELSIEEKARRYDEALKVLHKYDGANIMFSQSLKEEMFPELKESEDERISGNIIATIHLYYGEPLEDEAKEMIAWLEKQGEQKPSPKFREGDWLISLKHGNAVRVLEVLEDYYRLDFGEDTIGTLCTELVESDYRLWDITKDENQIKKNLQDNSFRRMFEQKPAWSEEDEEILNLIIARLHSHPNVEAEEYGKDYHLLKSLKDKVQPQPKQEWSEEDEMFVHGLIRGLTAKRDIHGHTTFSSDCIDITETINWLKFLKDRILPQQEWSEEDEQMMNSFLHKVEVCNLLTNKENVWIINKLKSLKPQNTWKPSEEMLEALYRVIPENVMEKSEDDMLLDKLYQGLKYGKVLSEK